MTEIIYPPYTAPLYPPPSSEHPSKPIPAGTEILPYVDEHGQVLGQMTRAYAHSGSFALHPVVHLHILNRSDELYLQKRASWKRLLPNRWDTAVGGHIDYGEHVVEALFRESSEELGFTDYNPTFIKSYVYESRQEKELVNVFACVGDFTPHPDHEEVSDGRYWTMKEIEDNLGKSVFTPNFEQEFSKVRKLLEALL
jgi:isopentenyldiphosphate isomerase